MKREFLSLHSHLLASNCVWNTKSIHSSKSPAGQKTTSSPFEYLPAYPFAKSTTRISQRNFQHLHFIHFISFISRAFQHLIYFLFFSSFQHANSVRAKAVELLERIAAGATQQKPPSFALPERDLPCRRNVAPGTWFARDNVFNFIKFCRTLGEYKGNTSSSQSKQQSLNVFLWAPHSLPSWNRS